MTLQGLAYWALRFLALAPLWVRGQVLRAIGGEYSLEGIWPLLSGEERSRCQKVTQEWGEKVLKIHLEPLWGQFSVILERRK